MRCITGLKVTLQFIIFIVFSINVRIICTNSVALKKQRSIMIEKEMIITAKIVQYLLYCF